MPDSTLVAVADHGALPDRAMPDDGIEAEAVLDGFEREGIDVDALAAPASARRRGGVRQVLARAAGDDRVQARRARRRVLGDVAADGRRALAGGDRR